MIAYDRVANTIVQATETPDGYITSDGIRPRRYIVTPPPQWALEQYAAEQAAAFDDERDTQESVRRG